VIKNRRKIKIPQKPVMTFQLIASMTAMQGKSLRLILLAKKVKK